MVEKPFGYDLESARELIGRLRHSFKEEQIFRIDHYLAKETAQNILTFRFANPVFQAVWDRHSVSRIEIEARESIGIEGRAAFYEQVGALRDIIQNHLMQLLAIVTMEQPAKLDSRHIHEGKLKLLEQVNLEWAQRGQYQGYRQEVGNPDSTTETFARVRLRVEKERWKGVPITLTTGKMLERKATAITFTFCTRADEFTNQLIFRIQPDEGIVIDLLAQKPGLGAETERVEMAFNYRDSFGDVHPNAYERVLMDGIRGDQTLFNSSDEVLASWAIVEDVVKRWSRDGEGLKQYAPGSAGPAQPKK